MLPEMFLKRMKESLGGEYDAFVESLGEERRQALRLNPLKKNLDGYRASEFVPEFLGTPERVAWEENGCYYSVGTQPGKHPYHQAGVYYIQEPSAMFPVSLLGVKPGDRVLDLCAAPGGKSTQIAACLDGEGLLVCNEIHPQRAAILSENIERMGVTNALVINEQPEKLSSFFPQYFDRILVDAPCSGEGMFRKNEEACSEWSLENVEMCATRQDGIMEEAQKMLRPGGRLVYSTCTFAKEEDEGSVERFVRKHPEFCVVETRRIWPHRDKGEGHFAALLEKMEKGDGMDYAAFPACGLERGLAAEEVRRNLGDFEQFARSLWKEETTDRLFRRILDVYGSPAREKLILFGENLYLIPQGMPAVKGMKVLRPGLHLGTFKKNRFEPAHALAMALDAAGVKNVVNLKSEEKEILQYLNGQTLPMDGEKGWRLVCVDGFGTGWGKLAGGMLKNHYPKGLRIYLQGIV